MKLKHLLIIAVSTFLITSRSQAQTAEEQKAVMQVVDSFMKAIDDKDTTAFNSLFIDEAYVFRIQEKKISSRPIKMDSGFPVDSQWKERLRKEELSIIVSGTVATVSAPYDFWINDAFSHCGFETFTLLKSKTGWKIASLTFSVEKENCK